MPCANGRKEDNKEIHGTQWGARTHPTGPVISDVFPGRLPASGECRVDEVARIALRLRRRMIRSTNSLLSGPEQAYPVRRGHRSAPGPVGRSENIDTFFE